MESTPAVAQRANPHGLSSQERLPEAPTVDGSSLQHEEPIMQQALWECGLMSPHKP